MSSGQDSRASGADFPCIAIIVNCVGLTKVLPPYAHVCERGPINRLAAAAQTESAA